MSLSENRNELPTARTSENTRSAPTMLGFGSHVESTNAPSRYTAVIRKVYNTQACVRTFFSHNKVFKVFLPIKVSLRKAYHKNMNKSYILAEIMMKFAEIHELFENSQYAGTVDFSRYTASVAKISRTDVGEACKCC